MVVAAVLNADLRERLTSGLFADHVDDAPGLALTVEHGGPAPQDVDAFETVEFHRAVMR